MKQTSAISKTMSILKKMGLLLFIIVGFSACQAVEEDYSGVVGIKAPAFTLFSTEGQQVQLFDYKDKVVVLYFFGNKCAECKATTPALEDMLITPYAGRKDYVVLALDYWNGDPQAVKAFKDETGIDIPTLLDAGNVGSNYKTFYNRIIVIDKDKNIVFSGAQEAAKDMAAAKAQIDNLLEN
ncbi:MAG: TlpA family protein disulfide reductase [Paludibacter sp.]|nr:TlpA family protein disulfide reductase [Paludibacter sp.]